MSETLTPSTYLILAALASGPMHGYAIAADAEKLSEGQTKLRAGTLYAALDRLTSSGLIAVDREEVVDSRLRRYYRLTGAGATALDAESAARAATARTAQRRLRKLRSAGGMA